MKKMLSIMVLAMMSFVASCSDYKEGVHFTEVSDKLSKKPEVREFFSFYCPHCYKFEPFFADVKKQLPKDIQFVRNHVDFLRSASPEIQFLLTKAVVVAKQLKVEEQVVASIFNHIHVNNGAFTSEADVRNVFIAQGIDAANFDKAFKSFATNSKAKQMKKTQDYYAKKRAITGVPATIVNGKYRVNTQELSRESIEAAVADYVSLVKHLQTLDK